MDDDFNTPLALASLFDLVTYANKFIHEKGKFTAGETAFIRAMGGLLLDLGRIFGLDLSKEVSGEEIDKKEIRKLIEERNRARKEKDYRKADAIRKKLSDMGVIIEDTKEGTEWRAKL